mgnify:FL=1
MKKLFLLFALLISAVQLSFADSALTSTKFYKAYLDVPIVKAAADQPNVLSEEAKAYLFDEANPLDVKLALINAVGWEIEGLTAYKDYLNYCIQHFPKKKYGIAPGKRVTIQDIYKNASCEQMAALVYLYAMNYYSDTESVYGLMENAMQTPLTNKQSFMLPMGLVVAHTASAMNDLGNIYPALNYYVNSPENKDMRPKAIEIVMAYANRYKSYANKQ